MLYLSPGHDGSGGGKIAERTSHGFLVFLLRAAALLALTSSLLFAASPAAAQTLEGRAALPAETFADGPESGAEIGESEMNGVELPVEGQPVQGFSAILNAGDGEYFAMPDNGYGAKDNSSDFLLRMYRITPDFETASGGSGEVEVGSFIELRDPDGLVPFDITNEDTSDRLLTGADFDPESVRMDANSDLWFGEEFGPFLLHTDETGRLLEAPVQLPGVASPENPTIESEDEANLPTSKGFEGMAVSDDANTLYPMLEGAVEGEDPSLRTIFEFDAAAGEYTGEAWEYPVEAEENAIGDLTPLGGGRFLVIERDDEEGEAAAFKKIYAVDFADTDDDGSLVKREAADLLDLEDPDGLSLPAREGDIGVGGNFTFPFQTVESVLPLGEGRMLVLNDNNFPFSLGRNPERPDGNEAIIVRSRVLAELQQVPATGGPEMPLASLAGAALATALAAAGMLGLSVSRRRIRR